MTTPSRALPALAAAAPPGRRRPRRRPRLGDRRGGRVLRDDERAEVGEGHLRRQAGRRHHRRLRPSRPRPVVLPGSARPPFPEDGRARVRGQSRRRGLPPRPSPDHPADPGLRAVGYRFLRTPLRALRRRSGRGDVVPREERRRGPRRDPSATKPSGHGPGRRLPAGPVRFGIEVGYSTVPNTIGESGVSKVYNEDDVGGLTVLARVAFGTRAP